MNKFAAMVAVCAAVSFAQTSNTQMSGTVTDPQGAAVPAAAIKVLNVNTNQLFEASSNEHGEWVIPSVPPATYSVSVSKSGFKGEVVKNVTVDAGVPATVDAKLQVGQTTDTVEVTAGAEIVQAESAAVASTVQARQIAELPFATRNAVELMVTQPGVQTPTNPRSSSINGLPRGALNVVLDGMNAQDNYLKSSDGFFSYIYTAIDSVEEITLTTSASGVDSTSQGAAQMKFVTKSGTNQFHGGVFYQNRNTIFNSNYYYNNLAGLPRDRINLNQGGFHLGGPILKNKLFFFTNFEVYRLPNTYNFTRTVLTPDAINGNFTYKDTTGKVQTVNLYQIAAQGNANLPAGTRAFPTTPDPVVLQTLQQINGLVTKGVLKSNISGSNDYDRLTYSYQPHTYDRRDFTTARIDYNLSAKHQLSFIYNYNMYNSINDGLNSVVPIYGGTGTILGTDLTAGQRSNRFAGTLSLRSVVTNRITNEFRAGLNGGTVLFRDAIASSDLFSQFRGYNLIFGNGSSTYVSGVTSAATSSRRNSPTKSISDSLSWVAGSHQLSFGGNWDSVALWQQTVNSNVIPNVTFGLASGDPANTGATDFFSAQLPNISTTDKTNAQYLYSILTGRIASIGRNVSLNENTKTYGFVPAIDRDRLREFGLFIQDTWRVTPSITVTAGLRYERQLPFVNLSNTYTRVGIAGDWGLSGVGNLFQPGNQPGILPTYQPANSVPNAYQIPAVWAPSLGAAWQLPVAGGPLKLFTGNHAGAAVLRAGYSIASVREGSAVFTSIWGSNQGLNVTDGVDPSSYPQNFGRPGSVLFRDPALPTRPYPNTPTYPIPACFTCSVNEFDPNLKMGYVQSWNLSYQRELGRDTVVDVRYTGNHGVHLWRQYNLNEVNIVENGFLTDFKAAQSNLAIARQTSPNSNNFGNAGLPGQQNLTIIPTALGTTNDSTFANYMVYGQAGTAANAIATNASRMANLAKGGYPANFFMANPTVAGGGAYLLTNAGSSFYDALQLEFRRRLSQGFTLQGSYVWSHSLTDGASNSSSDTGQPTTLRNLNLDRSPSPFDIRHAVKLNGIYELPIGQGKRFLANFQNGVGRRLTEGWQIAGVARLQSGTPLLLSSFGTFNQNGDGVTLHNMTMNDLQNMVGIYKSTGSDGVGHVYYLPQSVITNTQAAFGYAGLSPANVDPNAKYISPALTGQVGYKAYLFLPWQRHFDVSLIKKTRITEKVNLEFRAQALNVFNLTNFLPDQNIGSTFGQITTAYRDTSGTVDPGGRILEFVFRVNF